MAAGEEDTHRKTLLLVIVLLVNERPGQQSSRPQDYDNIVSVGSWSLVSRGVVWSGDLRVMDRNWGSPLLFPPLPVPLLNYTPSHAGDERVK